MMQMSKFGLLCVLGALSAGMSSAQSPDQGTGEGAPTSNFCENQECSVFEPVFEGPSLREIVRSEASDYPQILNEIEYSDRPSCTEDLGRIYQSALLRGVYDIPRASDWLETFEDEGRKIYFCDGNIGREYFDANNRIPDRWHMVRNSLSYFLE